MKKVLIKSCSRGGHATIEGFLEGSLEEVLLRRVLRGRLVRASVGANGLRGVLGRVVFIEGTWKVLRRQKHALLQRITPSACTLLICPSCKGE